VGTRILDNDAAVLQSLLEVGVSLSASTNREEVLHVVLREARKLTGAEAGSLYTAERGQLCFVACQNDRMDLSVISAKLVGKTMAISTDSLAGYVATTGQALNLPDTYSLPPGTPFHINRDFDSGTGYRTESALALPLMCPDGSCVGVLELLNHLDAEGRIGPFPDPRQASIRSLVSMAAVTIHNYLLQEELKKAHLETILRLSVAAEFRDDDTGEHVRRISRSSGIIARAMGQDADFVELIEWASPMHDIGKIGIPDAILLKPGPLTDAERRVVETHTTIGADILGEPHNELIAMAREVAMAHHEKWNGQGYPGGLKGTEICLSGRIVGLADVLDALVSKRCYKEAFPQSKALRIIAQEKGEHFDPDVVDAFFRVLDEVMAPYDALAAQADAR